jgi:hypothetical protein
VPQVDTKAKFDLFDLSYLSNVLVFVLQQGIDSFAFETIL